MKKIETLYLLDPKMKFKTFKELQKRLVKDSGPTPQNADKVVWELMKERHILCWFCQEMAGDVGLGFQLPPYKRLVVLKSPRGNKR